MPGLYERLLRESGDKGKLAAYQEIRAERMAEASQSPSKPSPNPNPSTTTQNTTPTPQRANEAPTRASGGSGEVVKEKNPADYAGWAQYGNSNRPLEVVCPVPGCGAEVGEPCKQFGREEIGCHTDRVTTWRQVQSSVEEVRRNQKERETSGRWIMPNGVVLTRDSVLAVQCPRCGAWKEMGCVTPKGKPMPNNGLHVDRRHRAAEYWKED